MRRTLKGVDVPGGEAVGEFGVRGASQERFSVGEHTMCVVQACAVVRPYFQCKKKGLPSALAHARAHANGAAVLQCQGACALCASVQRSWLRTRQRLRWGV